LSRTSRASTTHPAEGDLKLYAENGRDAAIGEHLRGCARCSRMVANQRVGPRRLQEELPATSPRLHGTVLRAVRKAAQEHPLPAADGPAGPSISSPGSSRWLKTGGKLFLAGIVIYAGLELRSRARREKALQR
jgi:hypothetical protein